ncbi:MAG: Transcriptional regulatory protein terminal, partial [Candidatus Eremiobacteraeota bacterium]|nr:Transcriptional regulatory protein terminal [Candidatus Eremiobacteraeota bacterium]
QDVRLDFIDRLAPERRTWLLAAYRRDRDALAGGAAFEPDHDLLAHKLARADGLLLRDGVQERVPGIVLAALDAAARPATQAAPARDAAPAVAFDVLSSVITSGGELVRLPRREFEVFANLAIKGRRVPYDVLLEEVWGDADDDHAKLKVTVGRLRKRLGFETIRSIDAGYAIGANVTCTLAELEELASAQPPLARAALERLDAMRLRYRRELAGTARNWRWYTAWSAKADALIERAAVALGTHALEKLLYDVALDRARDAIALNAVSQDAHELALRALVAQGNAVGARQLLAAYAATLRRTLGMPVPDAVTRILRDIAS